MFIKIVPNSKGKKAHIFAILLNRTGKTVELSIVHYAALDLLGRIRYHFSKPCIPRRSLVSFMMTRLCSIEPRLLQEQRWKISPKLSILTRFPALQELLQGDSHNPEKSPCRM